MQDVFLKTMMDHAPVGLVFMDEQRNIHYMNQKAVEMTNWQVGDLLPHCLYCQARELTGDGEQCILALDDPLPLFRTQLPTSDGHYEMFEVRTNKLTMDDGKVYMVVSLTHPKSTQEQEQTKVEQLLVRETMRVQEVERKRIARELHDQIGQSVYSIFLGVQGMKNHLAEPKYIQHLYKMERSIELTLDEIKRLSKELRPSVLDKLGIKNALQTAAKDWAEIYGIRFKCDCDAANTGDLSNEAELQLFRVIQEAVHNAARHGKARQITIHLENRDQNLYFEVLDDGIGFDVRTLRNRGLGLYHMKERMSMVNGDVKWTSQSGGPTRIEGYIPLGNRVEQPAR